MTHFLNRSLAAMAASMLLLPSAFTSLARAEEGMWTFDNPPAGQLQSKYGFTPSREWLDHIRLSSVRLNDGGSGSFVSPHGLLLTNHHVARGQLQKNSTAEHDYIANGFYAPTQADEMKTPDLEVNVLVSMENVTSRIQDAIKGAKNAEDEFAKRKAAVAAIEQESNKATGLRSDIVTLYSGGEYWLYRYKKYTDVRLVFAPEQQAAFYGGDPDNFTFPRYDLDMAVYRVYEDGKPLESKDYLKWNPKGAADGELVFVSGHPGSTSRLETVAQLQHQRDYSDPAILSMLRRRISTLREYSARGPEQARQAGSQIFGLENSVKAISGELAGLQNPATMAGKKKDEDEFRAKVMANPQWKAAWGSAWDDIAGAEKKAASRIKEQYFHAFDSHLLSLAYDIVEYVAEVGKPDAVRLAGFHEAQLESLRFEMFSPAPVYPEMDIARITGSLTFDLENADKGDKFLTLALDGKTPAALAEALVRGTKLADPAFRKSLIDGGEAAVNASTDPMIVLARKLDPLRREMIKWSEDNIQSVTQRAGEKLGKARFAVYGRSAAPDATFTLRLSYGTVKGYPMNGTQAPSKTTYYGLYDRAESFDFKPPFNLPSRYVSGKDKLNLSTPLNFVTTNDIIGGNSGSPVINRAGDIVGLIFDGNIESLVGDFVYDGESNRAVAVHTAAMTEALGKLYGAGSLLDELTTDQAVR